jgi:hypothetical protein
MSRRTTRADAEAAAAQASEAARTLAARSHEARAEEPYPREDDTPIDGERIERMLKARPSIQAMDEIVKKRGQVEEPEPEVKTEAPKVTSPRKSPSQK